MSFARSSFGSLLRTQSEPSFFSFPRPTYKYDNGTDSEYLYLPICLLEASLMCSPSPSLRLRLQREGSNPCLHRSSSMERIFREPFSLSLPSFPIEPLIVYFALRRSSNSPMPELDSERQTIVLSSVFSRPKCRSSTRRRRLPSQLRSSRAC